MICFMNQINNEINKQWTIGSFSDGIFISKIQ